MYDQRSFWVGKHHLSNNFPLFTPKMVSNVSPSTDKLNASTKKSQIIAFHSSMTWKIHFEASKYSNKLMVIDFTATWCGPCRAMEPFLNDLSAKYRNIEIIKIDVDELIGVAKEYKVQTLPAFILIKNGKQVDKVVGAKKEELHSKIKTYIG